MKNTHTHNCRYKDDDKLQYALVEIADDTLILMAAEEVMLYSTYLGYALNSDKDISIDFDESDNEPLQIMYGGLMFDSSKRKFSEIEEYAQSIVGYALFDIEEKGVNVSGYEAIKLFYDERMSDNFIPFAALIRTKHQLQNCKRSITMFPATAKYKVFEAMVNRPFLLACRESIKIDEVTLENWEEYIDMCKLKDTYVIADLVTD